jgi:hypothetical protein
MTVVRFSVSVFVHTDKYVIMKVISMYNQVKCGAITEHRSTSGA